MGWWRGEKKTPKSLAFSGASRATREMIGRRTTKRLATIEASVLIALECKKGLSHCVTQVVIVLR